jgi:hypothetical protein
MHARFDESGCAGSFPVLHEPWIAQAAVFIREAGSEGYSDSATRRRSWQDEKMLEPSRRIPYRTWPSAFAVLLAIAGCVGGLTFWDNHTSGSRPLAERQTVAVGHARFVPANGWLMDVSRSKAGKSVMLFKGGHRFLVTTGPWSGGPEGPLVRQQRLKERGQGLRIDGDASDFVTPWGLQGKTFAYYGPKLAGRFWQVVDLTRGSLVQIDFYGPSDGLSDALIEARSMLESMDLEAPL